MKANIITILLESRVVEVYVCCIIGFKMGPDYGDWKYSYSWWRDYGFAQQEVQRRQLLMALRPLTTQQVLVQIFRNNTTAAGDDVASISKE